MGPINLKVLFLSIRIITKVAGEIANTKVAARATNIKVGYSRL